MPPDKEPSQLLQQKSDLSHVVNVYNLLANSMEDQQFFIKSVHKASVVFLL
jgi:hypothetical protein